MSVELVERAALALGPMLDEVVFAGAATIGLWLTDPAAPGPRPTKDVDVVVEVTTRVELHKFEARLRARGFREDTESPVICRWRHGEDRNDELILDAMPAKAALMGFENRWQSEAIGHAAVVALPSGVRIRAISPPFLVATKLEAFVGRGRNDHLGSRDLEDIILLVDGREELANEVADAPADLREYLNETIRALLDEPRFVDAVFGFLRPDAASQARAELIVLPRIRALTGET